MEQLKLYITLLKCDNIVDTLKILQSMEHDNRVLQYNHDINTALLDADWLSNFIETHTQCELANIMRNLHTFFNVECLKLTYKNKNVTPANFIWDNIIQRYIYINGRQYILI